VHVIAAFGLVRNDPAMRALLAVFLDGGRRGLLDRSVAAQPVCAGLTWVGVAVGETVPEVWLKIGFKGCRRRDAIHVVAACTRHAGLAGFPLLNMTAFAARAQQRVFPGGLESQKLVECLNRDAITDKIIRHRCATVVTADQGAAIIDSHSKISAHAALAALQQAARHAHNILLRNRIVAVGALYEVRLHDPSHSSRSCVQSV
jgi:hypothetical protein